MNACFRLKDCVRFQSFWDVMLENKYVVFQAKKYFMTLSLKIWILSLSQRLLCFWSFQYYALKVSQFSSIKSCMYFQYISQMLVRCWQQNYPKMSPAQSMVCLPLKGTSPIIPEMQDLSKMPFTSVSSGCFFQLSVNFFKGSMCNPCLPTQKRGKRLHSLTHRWARSFGKDQ